MLNKILATLAAIGTALALIFRSRSKQHKAESEKEAQRADMTEAVNKTHQRVEQARQETQQQHREEQRDAQERLDAGRHDHLDNDW